MVVAIDEEKGRQDDDRTDCRGDLVAAALFILRPNRLCRRVLAREVEQIERILVDRR